MQINAHAFDGLIIQFAYILQVLFVNFMSHLRCFSIYITA